jgi:hypothetical protein
VARDIGRGAGQVLLDPERGNDRLDLVHRLMQRHRGVRPAI